MQGFAFSCKLAGEVDSLPRMSIWFFDEKNSQRVNVMIQNNICPWFICRSGLILSVATSTKYQYYYHINHNFRSLKKKKRSVWIFWHNVLSHHLQCNRPIRDLETQMLHSSFSSMLTHMIKEQGNPCCRVNVYTQMKFSSSWLFSHLGINGCKSSSLVLVL